jgi:hypothetical protein
MHTRMLGEDLRLCRLLQRQIRQPNRGVFAPLLPQEYPASDRSCREETKKQQALERLRKRRKRRVSNARLPLEQRRRQLRIQRIPSGRIGDSVPQKRDGTPHSILRLARRVGKRSFACLFSLVCCAKLDTSFCSASRILLALLKSLATRPSYAS